MSIIPENIQSQIDIICHKCKEIKPRVAIHSLAYNHEPYVREALEGFINQQTDFPFVAIVHDDASTDNTAEIIKDYAEKYPEIIFPLFEKENQYSKGNGILNKIMETAIEATGAEYIALCEGDDYWIDPLKLQKQVLFLEKNTDYHLCATNVINKDCLKEEPSKWNSQQDRDLSIEEIIMNGGLFLATTSLLIKKDILMQMPSEAKKLHVGDYPLQIYFAYVGKVRLLADVTCVYREASIGSWSESILKNKFNKEHTLELIQKELLLLKTMNDITNRKYQEVFSRRYYIYRFQSSMMLSVIQSLRNIIFDPILIFKYAGIKKVLFSLLPLSLKRKIVQMKLNSNI